MTVVVQNLLEGALVDHCLMALEAGSLLAFEGRDRQRAELDAVHRSPGSTTALENPQTVETGALESLQ